MDENAQAKDLVLEWIAGQPRSTPLLASIIARELRSKVSPTDVATVLGNMAAHGQIRRVFAVRTPNGVILGRTFPSVDAIGAGVRDAFNRLVPADDLEVIPAFERSTR